MHPIFEKVAIWESIKSKLFEPPVRRNYSPEAWKEIEDRLHNFRRDSLSYNVFGQAHSRGLDRGQREALFKIHGKKAGSPFLNFSDMKHRTSGGSHLGTIEALNDTLSSVAKSHNINFTPDTRRSVWNAIPSGIEESIGEESKRRASTVVDDFIKNPGNASQHVYTTPQSTWVPPPPNKLKLTRGAKRGLVGLGAAGTLAGGAYALHKYKNRNMK